MRIGLIGREIFFLFFRLDRGGGLGDVEGAKVT